MDNLFSELTALGINPEEFKKTAEEELARRRMGSFLLSNPFAFQRNLLCPPDRVAFLRPFHERGLDFVNRVGGKRKKLILWPRGHLKSTIFTQGEATRRAIARPDIRILINSSTYETGKTFLNAIKGHFLNPDLIAHYGELLPNNRSGKAYRNNESELTLLTRRNLTLKEPTFTASGLDKTKTSQHYDLIIHDDLVCRENVGSYDMMDRTWRVWQDSLDLLEPDGEMWIIGTRWHPLDLYGRILSDYCDERCVQNGYEHVDGCRCDFDASVMTIKDSDGHYIFDSKFDEAIADELLRQKGRVEFSAQYLNNPTDPGVCWFPQHKVEAAEIEPHEIDKVRADLVWYMSIDPAESLEKRSSFTACVAVGVDHSTGIWYVDYANQSRVDTAGFVDLVFSARDRYKPQYFGMEFNTRKALEYVLRDQMAKRNDLFHIQELKPMLGRTPDAKRVRIQRLLPLFEFGRIKINKKCHDLLNILYTLPNAVSWDLADALSYVMDMVPKGLAIGPVDKTRLPIRHTQNKAYTYAIRRRQPQFGFATARSVR